MSDEQTLLVSHTQIDHHPDNMHSTYPEDVVREIALAILEKGQPEHPLIVVPAGERFHAVDGNVRLEGYRYIEKVLKHKPPDVPIVVRQLSRLEQLLTMVRTNTFAAVNPVDEARHYQRLVEAGLKPADIARETGRDVQRIRQRLQILKLADDAQQMIAEGKIGVTAVPALIGLKTPEEQSQAARFAVEQKMDTWEVGAMCDRIKRDQLFPRHHAKENPSSGSGTKKAKAKSAPTGQVAGRAAVAALTEQLQSSILPRSPMKREPVAYESLRAAVLASCAACEVPQGLAIKIKDEEVEIASERECKDCGLYKKQRQICQDCPLYHMLKLLNIPALADRSNKSGAPKSK